MDVNKPPQMSHFNFQGKDAKEFDLKMNPITEESPDADSPEKKIIRTRTISFNND